MNTHMTEMVGILLMPSNLEEPAVLTVGGINYELGSTENFRAVGGCPSEWSGKIVRVAVEQVGIRESTRWVAISRMELADA